MISKNPTRPLALLIFEGALVYSCGVMAIYIRFGPETPYALGAGRVWLKTLLVTVLVLASFYLFDLYDFSRIRRRAALLLRLSQSLVVGGPALARPPAIGPSRAHSGRRARRGHDCARDAHATRSRIRRDRICR